MFKIVKINIKINLLEHLQEKSLLGLTRLLENICELNGVHAHMQLDVVAHHLKIK